MTEIVNRIINYTSEIPKCFLCDRKFSNGDVPWPLFKKRLGKDGQIDCALSAILSSALGKAVLQDSAHSKVLCDECNFILIEYDSIEKRLQQFRLEILADYNNTAKANGLEPIWFQIRNEEEGRRLSSPSKRLLTRKRVKSEEEIVVDHNTMQNNLVIPNFIVNVQQGFNTVPVLIKTDAHMDANRIYGGVNGQVMAGVGHGIPMVVPKSTKKKRSTKQKPPRSPKETIDFHFTGSMYICSLCPENSLHEPMSFPIHLKTIHKYNYCVCSICCKGFNRRNELNDHMDTVHLCGSNGEFQCKTCQQVFLNHHLFRLHKRFHYDSMKKYECSACNKRYLSQKLLDEHMNMHIGNRPYKCMSCDKDFASKYTLKAHVQTHTSRRKEFKCDLCDKSYLNKRNLINHKKLH